MNYVLAVLLFANVVVMGINYIKTYRASKADKKNTTKGGDKEE